MTTILKMATKIFAKGIRMNATTEDAALLRSTLIHESAPIISTTSDDGWYCDNPRYRAIYVPRMRIRQLDGYLKGSRLGC